MNRRAVATWVGACGLVIVAGCADDHRRPELRAALDAAELSLVDSVDTALTTTQSDRAERARIVVADDPQFSVAAVEVSNLRNVRIDGLSGDVLAMNDAGAARGGCSDQIPLIDALEIAEAEIGGDAVQSVPDDDVACAFEIQVLDGEILWEVKLASDGAVLETELSDEFSGGDDD